MATKFKGCVSCMWYEGNDDVGECLNPASPGLGKGLILDWKREPLSWPWRYTPGAVKGCKKWEGNEDE